MSIVPISYCILLIIVSGTGIVRYRKLTMPFRVLTWSVPTILVYNILSPIFSARYKTNAPILQLECITDFTFYLTAYYFLFKNKLIKKTIVTSLVIAFVFFCINAVFFQPFLTKFPTYVYFPTQVLFAIFSLLLFKEMLMYPLKINIIKQSTFWYNTAMLFYATTMFFYFGLSNYFGDHNFHDLIIYYFWYFILFVFHILIGVSLLTDDKNIADKNAR